MTSHNAREPVEAIPEDIFQTACGIVMEAKSLKSMLKHKDVVDAIARAIHDAVMAERQRDQWQPIETAPKDGTPILAADKGPYPFVAEWFIGGRNWIGADGRYWQPDRWMPLPAAPKGGAE